MNKNILVTFGVSVGVLLAFFVGIFIGSQKPVKKGTAVPASVEDSMHVAPAPADETIFKSLQSQIAPDFDLTSFDGKTVKLSDYKGKKIVLFFNEGAMCAPSCWDQMKAFSNDSYFSKNNVAVFSIVVDDKKTWQDVVNQDPALKNSLVLLDISKKISQTYGVLTVTSSMHRGEYPGHSYVVLDREGIIRNVFDDPNMQVNNLEIKEALNRIL